MDELSSWDEENGPETPILDTVNYPVHLKVSANFIPHVAFSPQDPQKTPHPHFCSSLFYLHRPHLPPARGG